MAPQFRVRYAKASSPRWVGWEIQERALFGWRTLVEGFSPVDKADHDARTALDIAKNLPRNG